WVEIAHEALIRRWTRLQKWLLEDRADQMLLHELENITKAWSTRRNQKDRGEFDLPSGGKLEAFEELERRTGALPSELMKCLKAARDRRRRSRRRAQGVIIGLAALVIVALTQWRAAVHERNVAHSRELAAMALRELNSDSQAALLLIQE